MGESKIKVPTKTKLVEFSWTPFGAGTINEKNVPHGISNFNNAVRSITVFSGHKQLLATVKTFGSINVVVQLYQIGAITETVTGTILINYI